MAPDHQQIKSRVRIRYREVLADARKPSVKTLTWIRQWKAAYHRGLQYKIPELEDDVAVYDFIEAVGHRLDPQWAATQQMFLVQEESTHRKTLSYVAGIFEKVLYIKRTQQMKASYSYKQQQ